MTYSMLLSSALKDYDLAYKLGQVGLEIDKQYFPEGRCRTNFTMYIGIHHLKEHIRKSLVPLLCRVARGRLGGSAVGLSRPSRAPVESLFQPPSHRSLHT